MPGIADRKTTGGLEERGHDRGCEVPCPRQRDKLLIEQPHKFRLIETVDEPPHERPQIGSACGD